MQVWPHRRRRIASAGKSRKRGARRVASHLTGSARGLDAGPLGAWGGPRPNPVRTGSRRGRQKNSPTAPAAPRLGMLGFGIYVLSSAVLTAMVRWPACSRAASLQGRQLPRA